MKQLWTSFLFSSLALILIGTASFTQAQTLDHGLWDEGFEVPVGGRNNILNLDSVLQKEYVRNGQLHAQIYPVEITGTLPPLRPLEAFFENKNSSLFRTILKMLGQSVSGLHSMDDVTKSLGLHPYPEIQETGVYTVPYPNNSRPDYRLGFSLIEKHGVQGFTFSCATCHSSNLFGKTVLGMTNRFPHANDFFVKMSDITPKLKPMVGTWLWNQATGSSREENQMMTDTLKSLDRVNLKKPLAEGLDTSLAQVSLSLNKRSNDAWATPNKAREMKPTADPFLDHRPADSKPAVWWNLKYKNRWLSDGSVVSGNPIITNILWNEIGRGTDLKILNTWIQNNRAQIDEITAAAFSSEAPRITDFFNENQIDMLSAKRGETLFNSTCSKCHGQYEKAWSQPGSERLSITEQLKTTLVKYPQKTRVIDVGTDPNRYLGMKSLEQLNRLQISKDYGVRVVAQKGYVPPPLVGIWARWPYFHNNSVPSLCAVLTPWAARPQTYYAGEANNTERDFDFDCNGYPADVKTPIEWKTAEMLYDTSKEGLHNTGHDEGIFIKNGVEILTASDKKDLIRFLQTL